MQAYSIEKVVTQDGKILLDTLPFSVGETVQIIILPTKPSHERTPNPLLKGSVIQYSEPLEPIAQGDWAVLQ